MIRINLLPYRAARKRENIKRQITLYVLCVLLLLSGMVYSSLTLTHDLSVLKSKEGEIQADLAKLQKTVNKISELDKKTRELKDKLNVITDLENSKTGPVLLLAEISKAVPKDKLWLRSLSETGGVLTLAGTAMDNETVALFMTNLEAREHILAVDLGNTKLRNLPQYRLNVSDFQLTCKTYAFKEPEKPQTKPAKRRRKK